MQSNSLFDSSYEHTTYQLMMSDMSLSTDAMTTQ